MNNYDKQYMNVVEKILNYGYYDYNRTGVFTYKIPHQIMTFDLSKEFPILQSKRVAFKTSVKEMLWIYKDQSNDVTKLQEQNVHIWDEWAVGVTSQNLIEIEPKKIKKDKISKVSVYGDFKSPEIKNYFGIYLNKWIKIWEQMIDKNSKSNDNTFIDESFLCCENFLKWVMNNNRYDKTKLGELVLDKDYYKSNCYSDKTCVLLTKKEKKSLYTQWYKYNDSVFYSKLDLAKYFYDVMHIKDLYYENDKLNKNLLNKLILMFNEEGSLDILNPTILNNGKYLRFDLEVRLTIKKAYGYQVNKFKQIDKLIKTLKTNPQDRRMIISLWNIEDLPEMQLQPCCFQTIFDVTDNKLNCMLIQRSGDWALGIPFNTTQYAVLVHMIAQVTGLKPGLLTHIINNAHIYENQIDGMRDQLLRYKKMKFIEDNLDLPNQEIINKFNSEGGYTLSDNELKEIKEVLSSKPKLVLNPNITNFYDFTIDDINLVDYNCLSTIKMPVSV